jgi:two-component system, NtrC family, sensor kinase
MKDFAHPDQQEMAPVDLNRAIESTLTISRHEYKLVAEVETRLEQLPPVHCHLGEVNQAILNIVVNAAHAIADNVSGSSRKGRIAVSTRRDRDDVVIAIQDTGGGIKDDIRHRIFDPFFTTKSVGRGTGQGLAISRSVVVDHHGGDLWFESVLGEGTTFFIRLPIDRRAMPQRVGA